MELNKAGWTPEKKALAGDRCREMFTKDGRTTHRLYGRWVALWRHGGAEWLTEDEIDPEWRRPWKFYHDIERECGPIPAYRANLVRIDKSRPIGPGNVCWHTMLKRLQLRPPAQELLAALEAAFDKAEAEAEEDRSGCVCPFEVRLECSCTNGAGGWLYLMPEVGPDGLPIGIGDEEE